MLRIYINTYKYIMLNDYKPNSFVYFSKACQNYFKVYVETKHV